MSVWEIEALWVVDRVCVRLGVDVAVTEGVKLCRRKHGDGRGQVPDNRPGRPRHQRSRLAQLTYPVPAPPTRRHRQSTTSILGRRTWLDDCVDVGVCVPLAVSVCERDGL